MQKVSIGDIAEKLGISKTTVSFVLNNKGDEKNISKSTQEKILNLIEELDYRPSFVAQSLKKGKTHTIGYLVPDISNPFFAKIGRGIEDLLIKHNYQLFIGSTDENPEKEDALIHSFISRQVDGLIIASSNIKSKKISNLLSSNFPLVFFDREDTEVAANFIVVENKNSMKYAVNQLIEVGKKRIGLLTLTPDVYSLKLRIEGYKEALRDNGIDIDLELIRIIQYDDIKSSTQIQINYLLERDIDAIAFTNNLVAAECIWALNMYFKEYIEKLELASFDNIELFDYSMPRIISLAQPTDEIANYAVNTLIDHIKNRKAEFKRIELEPKLIKR